MPGRIARTQTAVRVADFLATREGKAHLSNYGWEPGMPIVMTQPNESLTDAMGMVSIHGRDVLVAMINPETEELQLLYVTTPQPALKVKQPSPSKCTTGEFFHELGSSRVMEFRVKFWKHTAVAHLIPSCPQMQAQRTTSTRYSVPTR